jgi:hypothetical protein
VSAGKFLKYYGFNLEFYEGIMELELKMVIFASKSTDFRILKITTFKI